MIHGEQWDAMPVTQSFGLVMSHQSPFACTLPESSHFQVIAPRRFSTWLVEHHVSLVFTTYRAGKLFFVGFLASDRLSVFERMFVRAVRIWTEIQTVWSTSTDPRWRFQNAFWIGELADVYDRCYLDGLMMRDVWHTGEQGKSRA